MVLVAGKSPLYKVHLMITTTMTDRKVQFFKLNEIQSGFEHYLYNGWQAVLHSRGVLGFPNPKNIDGLEHAFKPVLLTCWKAQQSIELKY